MRTLTGVCVCSLALALPAQATSIVPADLGELSRDARAIVRGRVVALDAQWTDDRGTIETIVTLEVESYLKGSLGPTLQFRVPGGDARTLPQHRRRRAGVRASTSTSSCSSARAGRACRTCSASARACSASFAAADDAGWVVTPPAMLAAAADAGGRIVRGDRRAGRCRSPIRAAGARAGAGRAMRRWQLAIVAALLLVGQRGSRRSRI